MRVPVNVAVVIPCLNEGESIAHVVAGARSYVYSVVIVDDGSADETAAMGRAAGALVIRHQISRFHSFATCWR